MNIEEEFIATLWHSFARVLIDHMATAHNQVQGDEDAIGSPSVSPSQQSNNLLPSSEKAHNDELFVGVNSPSRAAANNGNLIEHNGDEMDSEDSLNYIKKMVYVEQLELCPIKVSTIVHQPPFKGKEYLVYLAFTPPFPPFCSPFFLGQCKLL